MIAEWYMVITLLAKDRGSATPIVQRATGFVSQQHCEDYAKTRWQQYYDSGMSRTRYLDTLCQYDNKRVHLWSRVKCDQSMSCVSGRIPY